MNFATDLHWHKTLLMVLAARLKPKCFLELGLGTAPAINVIADHCDLAFGVDKVPTLALSVPNVKIFVMSTDEFFAEDRIPPPELVFIDADHSKEQALKDFKNAAAICAPNAIVVFHDTFPESEPYTASHMCSDSFAVPAMLDVECVTIPAPPGVTICRVNPTRLF